MIKSNVISVDCIKCNRNNLNYKGIDYYGFDFYVRENEKDNMISTIRNTLDETGIPYEEIYDLGSMLVDEKYIWNKEKIVETIKNEAPFFLELKNKKTNRKIVKKR